MSAYLNRPLFDQFIAGWLALGALFSLLGNAASDLWLSSVAVLFLVRSFVLKDWSWAQTLWVRLALVFWVWLLVTTTFSPWDGAALGDAAAWLRFPIFAIGFGTLMATTHRSAQTWAIAVALLGLLIFVGTLGVEKFNNPDATRLYGTWGQNIKAGWYLYGFGLPVALWALGAGVFSFVRFVAAVALVCVLLAAFAISGDVYVTLSFLFGVGLFSVLSVRHFSFLLVLAAIGCLVVAAIYYFTPEAAHRFYWSLTTRLPWMTGSDYFVPWMRGLYAGFAAPIMGQGVGSFEQVCNQVPSVHVLDIEGALVLGCQNHPHQLYIQTFAETGIVGLVLFVGAIGALLFQKGGFKGFYSGSRRHRNLQVAGFCLLVAAFWPISSYSDAFGQHRNFFTWYLAAWAIGLRALAKRDAEPAG